MSAIVGSTLTENDRATILSKRKGFRIVALRCERIPNYQIVVREVDLLADVVLHAFYLGRDGGGRELKCLEIENERICEQVHLLYQEVLDLANNN